MRRLNLNKLIEVKTTDFNESKWYHYIKGYSKKYFWQTSYKEGIYINFMGLNYIGEVPENHILIDDVVYEKPNVIMIFENNITQVKYFESFEQAKSYTKNITYGANWI